MFFKKNEINPFTVSDRVRFRNIDRTLDLEVRSGASALVLGMNRVQEQFQSLKDDSSEEERLEASRSYAETLFGKEQAEKLIAFYDNDYLAIINACTLYFSKRLSKLITKAQRKR